MATLRPAKSFPVSDYTPHGYLDNPHHTMVLHRSGAVRSLPPLGFGYWLTDFEGSYGCGQRDHTNYLSLLQVSMAIDGAAFVETEDFAAQGVRLTSQYHTKHVMSYDWAYEGVTVCLRYFLPRENTLACLVEIANEGRKRREVVLHATNLYGLWDAKYWGSNGVAAQYVERADATVSHVWACGHAMAVGADARSVAHKATADEAVWRGWMREGDLSSTPGGSVDGPGPLRAVQSYRWTLKGGAKATMLLALSRGPNEARVLEELKTGLRTARGELAKQFQADEAFWSRAPMLEGDWPAAWKHGWVYDYETLRMNVRPPIGIYRHHWDAMQIHAPRAVLGEASLDAMALSYAAPDLATDVLLGTFADAPAPNVPCSREDGSMNMIAADGSECGTYPAWGLPFHVIRSIYARTGDARWVRALYPHLGAFLNWWLEHRTDADGWVHCKCSWEAQDGSKRFLIPEDGSEGSVSDYVRTVDAEAAMAEAMEIMAEFATVVRKPADAKRWRRAAEDRARRVRAMYVDGWFRDFDGRSNRPILLPDYVDVMMLVPLACGMATPEQIEAIRPRFNYFRENPSPWLEWPSFVFPLSEAAWNAGEGAWLAEVLAEVADRIYARSDRQTVRVPKRCEGRPLQYRVPGQAPEYWPISDEPAYDGGECYGWGATLPMNLIRNVIGFREAADPAAFVLAPALPERLRRAGGVYAIRNLRHRDVTVRVAYEVTGPQTLRVTLDYAAARAGMLRVSGRDGVVLAAGRKPARRGQVAFDLEVGGRCEVQWG